MLFLSHCAYEIAKSDLKKQTQLPRIRLYTIFPTDHLAVFFGTLYQKIFFAAKNNKQCGVKEVQLIANKLMSLRFW